MIPKVTPTLKLKGFDSFLDYVLSHKCPNCLSDVRELCEGMIRSKQKTLPPNKQHAKRVQIAKWHFERDIERAIRENGSLDNLDPKKNYSTTLKTPEPNQHHGSTSTSTLSRGR